MAKRKIIIFANGEIKKRHQAQHFIKAAEYIICADGGAVHCDRMGIIPDMVIGDMDSIPAEILEKFARHHTIIKTFPVHKDNTDLELAVHYAHLRIKEMGAASIHIFGGLGGRWDMSLATILLLTDKNNLQQEIVIHGDQEIFYALQPGAYNLQGTVGQRISFLSLHGDVKKLSLSGLRYPARKITLNLGSSLGVSNRFVEEKCLVTFAEGILLVVLDRITEKRKEQL